MLNRSAVAARSSGQRLAPTERQSVPDLARRLAGVITERQLVPGDRFFTTAEAARLLCVRRELANRALQVLVHRGRIERVQRLGARVCSPQRSRPAIANVHLVVQVNHARAATWSSSAFEVGLHAELPGCEVAIHALGSGQLDEHLRELVRQALRQRRPAGLVLVRCDYPTQRLAAECGLPVVLHGSPYAGIELPSVDVDGAQMGRAQAVALAQHGCERLVIVRRDRALPGDRAFLSGFRTSADELGFGGGAIEDLELAPFPEVVAAELAALFRTQERLGIVCATRELADAVLAAASVRGRVLGRDLWLHGNHAGHAARAPTFPCMESTTSDDAQGRIVGRLLASRLADPDGAVDHHRFACRLVVPEEAAP